MVVQMMSSQMGLSELELRDKTFEDSEEIRRIISTIPVYRDQKEAGKGLVTKVCESEDLAGQKMDEKLWRQLPEDLLPKIFAKLPFRCLFKISVLSKAWEANIRSPSLQMEATTEVTSKWGSYSPLLCSASSEGLQLIGYSRAAQQWQSLISLSSYLSPGGQLASSCWQMSSIAGSLMCLKQVGEPGQRGLLVTNPLLKSWRTLPPRGMMAHFLPIYDIIHLVCSEEKDSSAYKVVSISQDSSIRDPSKKSHQHPAVLQGVQLEFTYLRAEVYDSTTGAWTADESGPLMPMDLHNVSSVYLDGTVYFLLASSGHKSFHVFAYNVRKAQWTTIRPLLLLTHDTCSLLQLVVCGSSVMLVRIASPPAAAASEMWPRKVSSQNCKISEGSIHIYKIEPDVDSHQITEVCGGPSESIHGVNIVGGISGDEENIYLQVYGRPLVVVFNLPQKRWSTVAVNDVIRSFGQRKMTSRYFGPAFNWTNTSFQPGLNSFVAP